MASIVKTSTGYRVQVNIKGRRASESFRTKRLAEAWAGETESRFRAELEANPAELHTVRELLEKYRDEVSPIKSGRRWELVRINAFLSDPNIDPKARLSDVTSDTFGQWRNARAKQVAPGTVIRDLGLLSAIFEHARREWKWIPVNPISDVRRPPRPDHRMVLITRAQIKGMLKVMKYSRRRCDSITQAIAVAFLVALRTGMRAGELCALRWENVFEDYCRVPKGKNAAARRDVPLMPKARRLMGLMEGFDTETVFGLSPNSLDAMFRKYRNRAGLDGFTFHDSRHTAATWLARRLHILDLCLMFGWSNPKHAMIYYNAPASDIAKQLSLPVPGRSR